MKRAFEDYRKVKDTIKSCNNEDQLRVGVKMYNLLNKKYGDEIPQQYFDILENIIGLMRMKCIVGDEEEINEISDIGQEFRTQAAITGEPDLQKIVFDEDVEKGGVGDDMTAEDISEEYDIPLEDIKKEIYIGAQIEKEHTDNEKVAEEFAIDHIVKFIEDHGDYDYYTDPAYGIIAIEDKMGDNKKTLRISKKDMERLHDEGNTIIDDIELKYKEEEEVEESTGASSAGSYVGPMSREVVRRVIKKDIPVSVNGVVGKHKLNTPIGKLYSFSGKKNESEVLEEEDIEEATSYADAVGAYDTPGFPPSKFMGTAGKKGKAPVNKGITHQKLAYPGGDFVKIKNKCARFPYCNQSPEAIKISKKPFKDAFYENKTIKKRNLKIKK